MSKQQKFLEMIEDALNFYEIDFDEKKTEAYMRALSHLSAEQLKHGIKKHMLDPRFGRKMFFPADIIKQLEGRVSQSNGTETQGSVKTVDQFGNVHESKITGTKCTVTSCNRIGTLSNEVGAEKAWFCHEHFGD